jgi:RNA polymerase sigma-70 factor (TIGR02960 family)
LTAPSADPRQAAVSAVSEGSAVGTSTEAFGELVDPHRRELVVHCYRMLGSIDDAEDAAQEALVRAWRGRATFERNVSLRAWLYRIATNVCLDSIRRRGRARRDQERLGVGPYPDHLLGLAAGADARYDARESISLAFLTALQVLPPRQRAALILRDVLGWRAAEVAELLELSVPAANSALQRARATVSQRYRQPDRARGAASASESAGLRALLERYVRAWETADVAGLVTLLRDDAVLAMPPLPSVHGAGRIGQFLATSIWNRERPGRLVPTRANGSPAFLAYGASPASTGFEAVAILVLDVDDDRVARIDAFGDPGLFARFGAPATLPG